jgi:hypothetical protein
MTSWNWMAVAGIITGILGALGYFAGMAIGGRTDGR